MKPLLLALPILLATLTGAQAQGGGVQRLAWLQGCWASAGTDRVVEEQWMAPRGRIMLGSSRSARGDALIGYEFVILREQGDQLAYEVRPTGRPAVVFVSSALTDSSVLFENASHEFPQRIGYQRNGPASMLAWIEGSKDGQTRRFDFPYRQVVCAGG